MPGHLTRLVPRLRFPEFTGDWKKGKCCSIANVFPGYGFPKLYQGIKHGEYPFYKVGDISKASSKGKRYITEADNYINSKTLKHIGGKPVPKGTIIFAKIGEAIRLNRQVITTKPSVIDNNTAGIKAIETKSSDKFLFYLWSKVILFNHAGGVVPAVSKSKIENINLYFPADCVEQQKIADCLGSLDDLIEATGHKLEALRQHKRGLMQQLFPQQGEIVPRLRFPEFRNAGKWETKKLGELSHVVAGQSPKGTNINSLGEGAPFFQGKTDFGDIFLRKPTKWTTQVTKLAKPGDILLSVRAPVGALNITSVKICIGRGLASLQPKCNKWFLYYSLLAQQRNIVGSGGSVYDSINREQIEKLRIIVPPAKQEKKKIADCLVSLDDIIEATGHKLEALRQQKKGLMQQLFPINMGNST